MNRTQSVLVLLLSVFILASLGISESMAQTSGHKRKTAVLNGKKVAAGELLVGFKPNYGRYARNQVHADMQAEVLRSYKTIEVDLVRIPDWMTLPEALEVYSRFAQVDYVEPNYLIEKGDGQEVGTLATPNDTNYSSLWGLHNTGQSGGTADADIDAPEAWDITTGSNSIIVAVIDTGVDYTHPDLNDNMWVNTAELNGTNGLDDDNNGYVDDVYGYDFCRFDDFVQDGDPWDDDGHGTHCAGTIGAEGNNGIGVAGVNWDVRIMALKFIASDANGGSGYTSDAVSCIEYAVANGAHVLSNSWGGGGFSTSLYNAINNSGLLFVAAAGNGGPDGIGDDNDVTPHYPSNYDLPNVLSVASTTRHEGRSGFSNYGAVSVDIGAPGSSILSTTPGNTYSWYSGTSMATPHVAGAAALILSQEPGLSVAELKARILDNGDPIAAMNGITTTGKRLNVANALQTSSPVKPVNASVSPATGGSGSSQVFQVVWSDSNGTDNLSDLRFLVNGGLRRTRGVYIRYTPDTNLIHLANDDGTIWDSATPGSSTTLSNTQGEIDVSGVNVSSSGEDLTIEIPISFPGGSFFGEKKLFMYSRDSDGMVDHWEQMGTFTITRSNADPVNVSVSPNSGSGSSQTFTWTWSDADGYVDFSNLWILINDSINGSNAVYIRYLPNQNWIHIRNDANSGWRAAGRPGQSLVIDNSQVSIDLSTASATNSGSTSTLTMTLEFKPGFTGTKYLLMLGNDLYGGSTGWQNMGSFDVQ